MKVASLFVAGLAVAILSIAHHGSAKRSLRTCETIARAAMQAIPQDRGIMIARVPAAARFAALMIRPVVA